MRKKAKRPYKKPEVFKVKLTPTEAVLAVCKAGSGSGYGSSTGQICQRVCNKDPGS
jgi:hypothetical protein